MSYNEYSDKTVLESNIPCPFEDCGSSDAYSVLLWHDTQKKIGKCHSCGRTKHDPYNEETSTNKLEPGKVNQTSTKAAFAVRSPAYESGSQQTFGQSAMNVEDGLQHPIRALPDRMISYATAEHFGVRIGVSTTDGETPVYTLFPQYRKGELVGWKKKTIDKQYTSSGGSNLDLFGSNVVKPTGKKLYITEGELDALALYQVLTEQSTIQGWKPSVVSLPSGAQSAIKSLTLSQELLDGYEEIGHNLRLNLLLSHKSSSMDMKKLSSSLTMMRQAKQLLNNAVVRLPGKFPQWFSH
jgi:hypothetical protein